MRLSISRQLQIGVILSSTLITILITVYSLYKDFQNEIDVAYKRFDVLMDANSKGLENSVWDLNTNQILANLNGFKKFSGIDSIVLKYTSTEGDETQNIGKMPESHISKSYELIRQEQVIGTVFLYKDKNIIYGYVFDKLVETILLNALKTFLASFLILFIINFLLTRHLVNIINQLKQIDHKNLKDISIKRFNSNFVKEDEISYLVKTINKLFKSLSERSEDLEQKIESRTIELVKAKEDAERESAYKDTFFTRMSHEIRTPLSGIVSSADLLKEEDDQQTKDKLIEAICLCGQSLIEILNNSIENTRVESGQAVVNPSQVHLSEQLWSIYHQYLPIAKTKNVQFKLSMSETLPNVMIADFFRIRQILSNLLNNAMKFTQVGGEVILEVDGHEIDKNQFHYIFSVKDNGIGIEEKNYEKIFDKYTQADDSIFQKYAGAGLGLSIARNLAHFLGAELTVCANKHKGIIFKLEGRFNFTRENEEAQKSPKIEKNNYKDLRVLIVEDHEINRNVLSAFLSKFNIKADEAEDGAVAVKMVKENIYDLILMDIHMPVMDGHEATQNIRALDLSYRPIIFALTANAVEEEHRKALQSGMDQFYTKPISVKKLKSILLEFEENSQQKAS